MTPQAYCDARHRLSLDTLRLISAQIAWNLERRVLRPEQLLSGREVKIVDGTGISMPDTPENQAVWPQPKGQKPGCGFPVLKLLGLFSLAGGALLEHVTGRQNSHDSLLFRELWSRLKKGDVILADRAFCSYVAMAALAQRGIDTLVRLHQFRAADLRHGRRRGKHDRLLVWDKPTTCPDTLSAEEFAALPEQPSVRLIRTVITAKGFRTTEVTIATTLIDARLYPADTLRELDARRWNIELHFAQIKTTLEMDVFDAGDAGGWGSRGGHRSGGVDPAAWHSQFRGQFSHQFCRLPQSHFRPVVCRQLRSDLGSPSTHHRKLESDPGHAPLWHVQSSLSHCTTVLPGMEAFSKGTI